MTILILVGAVSGALLFAHARGTETALHILDVGQGDAMLVRHGSVDILIDGGPDATLLERLGEVRPFWDRRVDIVVLTHPQQDHLRGLLDVIEREKVGLVLLPRLAATSATFRRFVELLHARQVPVRAAARGQTIRYKDLSLTVLAPDATLRARAERNLNMGSVVVRVGTPSFRALLTGDIEAPTEQYLRNLRPASLLHAEVLKVPHHGSKTSSASSFLRAVHPQLAVISVGKGNRYGHPHPSILARYRGTPVLRTDVSGTISVTSRGAAHSVRLRCSRGCGK